MKQKSTFWLKIALLALGVAAIIGAAQLPARVTQAQDGAAIGYGSSVAGAISAAAPQVTYTFNGALDDLVQVDVIPLSDALEPVVDLLGPDGQTLVTSQHHRLMPHHRNAHITRFLPQMGAYTLVVRSNNGTEGNYMLRLQGRGLVTSTPLQYDVPVDVNIPQNPPTQYFTFNAENCPTTLTVTNRAEGLPYTFPFVVKVRNEAGRDVALLMGGDAQEDRVTVRALSGRYEVEVLSDDLTAAGLITLLVSCADAAPGCPAEGASGVGDSLVCAPCPLCEEDFASGTLPVCPDMDLRTSPAEPNGLTFTWNAVPGATSYWIYVYAQRDDGEILAGPFGIPDGTITSVPIGDFFDRFEGFWGFRFEITANQGEEVLCTDESWIALAETGEVCDDFSVMGRVDDHVHRDATWVWNAYPGAEAYYIQLWYVLPDGTEVPHSDRWFDAGTTSTPTHGLPLDSHTWRLRVWEVGGDDLYCMAEDTIVFEGDDVPQEAGEIPCEVQANWEGVWLHVGPGRGRTVFAFMPVGRRIEVTGMSRDSEDNRWWRIDKTQIPGHEAVISLWVMDSDVEEFGECEQVPEEDAPDIVPMEPQQWGPCGSCGTCGHPANECRTSPTGECVWDPASCAGQQPPPDDGGQEPPPDDGGQQPPDDGGEEPPITVTEPPPVQCVFIAAYADPSEYGTVTTIPDGNCPSMPGVGAFFAEGTVVQVQVTPIGSELDYWSGCGASGDDNPVTITANSTCHIIAHMKGPE